MDTQSHSQKMSTLQERLKKLFQTEHEKLDSEIEEMKSTLVKVQDSSKLPVDSDKDE